MVFLNPFLKAFAQMIYGQFPAASTEEAIAHYKKAIELAPERIVHHAEYAKALDMLGDTVAARDSEVVRRKPYAAHLLPADFDPGRAVPNVGRRKNSGDGEGEGEG